ncbi:hypothetical protein Tco_1470651, partial [Tanacetum coccineum]
TLITRMVKSFTRVGADGCVVMRASFSSSRILFCYRRKYVLATRAMISLISAKLRGCLLSDMFLPILVEHTPKNQEHKLGRVVPALENVEKALESDPSIK